MYSRFENAQECSCMQSCPTGTIFAATSSDIIQLGLLFERLFREFADSAPFYNSLPCGPQVLYRSRKKLDLTILCLSQYMKNGTCG